MKRNTEIKGPDIQIPLNRGHKELMHNLIDRHFDIRLANQLAEVESYNKHLYRPNTYLHKWWARRCGTTFRSILKHLVRDASKSDYYSAGGLEGQIILDPMMGGGTTLHEAIRMGANVIGADIDPVPVLQARASLNQVSLKTLEDQFATFFNALYLKLGHFYRATCPTCEKSYELRFVLYGVRRKCACGEAVFTDSYILRYNNDGSRISVCPETYNILHDEHTVSVCELNHRLPLYEKRRKVCACGEKYVEDTSVPYYRRYVPIAIVGQCPEHGLFFSAPRQSDLDLISRADAERENLGFDTADFTIQPGPKSSDLLKRGIFSYLDLFSSRQLLFLHHAINELRKVEPFIRLKLALLISTATEFNSMLCGYKGATKNRPGAIRHTFAHHAYSFPHTALENNPLHPSRSSGTLHNLFYSRMVRGHKWALKPLERQIHEGKTGKVPITGEADIGEEYRRFSDLNNGIRRFLLIHGSSTRLDLPDSSVDHIVTDPPYFDSVQYSDLAAFFRVWLKKLLPGEVQWDYSAAESAVDQQANGNGQYESVLGGIFSECHRVLRGENGRLIFTFHHWNPKGWAGLTLALKNAGFRLVSRYVIHAENPTSVHIANQNALIHDVILVLGKAGASPARKWEPVESVRRDDSYTFCEQCGTLLGYLLDSEADKTAIQRIWSELLVA